MVWFGPSMKIQQYCPPQACMISQYPYFLLSFVGHHWTQEAGRGPGGGGHQVGGSAGQGGARGHRGQSSYHSLIFFLKFYFSSSFCQWVLFLMARNIFRETAWHILIYTSILNTTESFSIFQMHLFTCTTTDKARKVVVWHWFLLQPPPDLTQTLPQNVPTKRPAPGTPLSVDSPQEPKRSRHSSGAPSEVSMHIHVHELWIDFKPKIVAKHSLSFNEAGWSGINHYIYMYLKILYEKL